MLTPYTLDFAARISVILLPWAGLPWMLALTIRALRTTRAGAWKYPAIFAIVVQIVGGVNATALVFAGIAPVLWILYAWLIRRGRLAGARSTVTDAHRRAHAGDVAVVDRGPVGAGRLRARHPEVHRDAAGGVAVVARRARCCAASATGSSTASTASGTGPTAACRTRRTSRCSAVSFAIPILALFAAMCVRWRTAPTSCCSWSSASRSRSAPTRTTTRRSLGGLFKSFAESSSFGLALRSTSRAVPLVALGLAVLLGIGVNAVAARWADRGPQWRGRSVLALAAAGLVIVLAIVNLPALWTGDFYTKDLDPRRGHPAVLDRRHRRARRAAARHPRARDPRLRLRRVPLGPDRRPDHARAHGPARTSRASWCRGARRASADLLNALDHRLQEGVLDPSSIAPVARLMSAGSIVYRADLQTDRYDLARAVPVWRLLTEPTPDGLGEADEVRHQPRAAVARPAGRRDPARAARRRQGPAAGEHLPGRRHAVDRAQRRRVGAAHRLRRRRGAGRPRQHRRARAATAWSSTPATFADDPRALRAGDRASRTRCSSSPTPTASGPDAGPACANTVGETERVDETALVKDENDNRLDVFPDAGTDAQTVVQTPGVEVSTSTLRRPRLLPTGVPRRARVRRRRRAPRGRSARTPT